MGSAARETKAQVKERDIDAIARLIEPIIGEAAWPEADRLVEQFQTVGGVLRHFAENCSSRSVEEKPVARFLQAVARSISYVLERELRSGPILPNSRALNDYLFNSMATLENEIFRVLFLSSNNRLIDDRVLAIGSTDRVELYPKEVVKIALKLNSTKLVIVHNHPSGDSQPSGIDLAITQRLICACSVLDLQLIDHLIVASGGITSLRELDLVRFDQPHEINTKGCSEWSTSLARVLNKIRKSI